MLHSEIIYLKFTENVELDITLIYLNYNFHCIIPCYKNIKHYTLLIK